jgi:hypothetical protein
MSTSILREEELIMIVAKEFSMRNDLNFFPMKFTLQDSYRISYHGI